jgi:[ribosomal protein S18]-alanine N-acetyltransferase
MIRKATAADAEALLALERSVPEAAHWSASEYVLPPQDEKDENSPLQRWIFVAEEDQALVGFIAVKLLRLGEETQAEIENLAVSLTARRRGVGAALCAAALVACGAAGAQAIELEVRAGNHAALGLYARLGFEQTGIRAGYYANPAEDAVLLQYKQKTAG